MKKNKTKSQVKTKIKKTQPRIQAKIKSAKKLIKAPAKKSILQAKAKQTNKKSINTKKVSAKTSARTRPSEAQTQKRFRSMGQGSDGGGEVFDSHEYVVIPRAFGLDESVNLEDPSAPEDTVTRMDRAEDEDGIARSEFEIPEHLEEVAVGDEEEDSDEATTRPKSNYQDRI